MSRCAKGCSRWSAGLAAFVMAAASAAPGAPLIESLAVEMDAADAAALAGADPFKEFTVPAAIVDGGKRLTGRAEIKGSSTRILPKKGLLLKLDDGMAWRGENRVVVDSRATDRTLMRDYLAWDLWRAVGMPAPDVHYLRLAVNGANRGVYLRVGWIKPALFDKLGLGTDGEFYQATDQRHCGNLSPKSVKDPEYCYAKLAPRDGKFDALEDLVAAIDAAPEASFHEFLDRTFEAESVVNWLALNAVISNRDTYDKNYFLYRSARTGKWCVLPFDFDLSQGTDYMPEREYPQSVLTTGFTYWHSLAQKLVNLPNPLREKALKNEVLRNRIRARLGELIDGKPGKHTPWGGWLAPVRTQERLAALHAALRPLVAQDPFMQDRVAQFDEAVGALQHYYRARLRYLQKMVVRDDALRIRDEASAALPESGKAVDLVDEGGFWLATLKVRSRARGGDASLRVRRAWPEVSPPDADRAACVYRTWTLVAPAGTQLELTLDYHQDTERPTELGGKADERKLRLYATPAGKDAWQPLATAVNIAANTLTAVVTLPAGNGLTLLACDVAGR